VELQETLGCGGGGEGGGGQGVWGVPWPVARLSASQEELFILQEEQ